MGKIHPMGRDKVTGYLTVNIYSDPPRFIPFVSRSKSRRPTQDELLAERLFKQARQAADYEGRTANHLVVVEFGHNRSKMCIAVELTPDAFETVRRNPQDYAAIPEHITPLSRPLVCRSALEWVFVYFCSQIKLIPSLLQRWQNDERVCQTGSRQ